MNDNSSTQHVAPADNDPIPDGGETEAQPLEDTALGSEAKGNGMRPFVEWVVVLVVALLVAILIRTFFLAHFKVEGTSMLNTLHPGDRVIVNKMSYRWGDIERGDVVVLHELGGERDLIKRVIALPGEVVSIVDCHVLIDGVPMEEDYLSESVRSSRAWCESPPVTVGDHQVFVLGDNRPASADSRIFGPVEFESVVGRAMFVFFPLSDARWL